MNTLEKYSSEHPGKKKMAMYVSKAKQLIAENNEEELNVLLKAAIADMKKFAASDNSKAKKKEQDKKLQEEEAAKAAEINAKLASLTYVPNVTKWAQQFTYDELKGVDDYVKGHIQHWKNQSLSQEQIIQKLINEQQYLKFDEAHPTAIVLKEALYYAAQKEQIDFEWTKVKNGMLDIQQYVSEHPKSEKMKGYLQSISSAVSSHNLTEAQSALNDAIKYKKNQEAAKKSALKKKNALKDSEDESSEKDVVLKDINIKKVKKIIGEFVDLNKTSTDVGVKKVNKELFQSLVEQWANLTGEEREVLKKYTETFNYLNEPLRGITYQGYRAKEEYEHDLPIMTNALKKCKTTKDITVRRGVSDYAIRELMKNLSEVKKGEEFTDGGFLSTALHPSLGFHSEITLIIVIPKGSMGIYAEPFSNFGKSNGNWNGQDDIVESKGHGGEFEFIGQRGSRFRVIRNNGNGIIYLQLIGRLYDQK